jgi:hypothetical protein
MIRQIFKPLAAGAALLTLTAFGPRPGSHSVNSKEYKHDNAGDLGRRATAIHWPEGFSPDTADLFSTTPSI